MFKTIANLAGTAIACGPVTSCMDLAVSEHPVMFDLGVVAVTGWLGVLAFVLVVVIPVSVLLTIFFHRK